MTQEQFIALAAGVEAAKQPGASQDDRLWLDFHQQWAISRGLHPDAICASPLPMA